MNNSSCKEYLNLLTYLLCGNWSKWKSPDDRGSYRRMRRSIEDAIRAPVNGDRDMEMNESRPSMSTFNEPVPTSQSLIVWSVEQEKISLSSVQQRADTLPLWPDNVRSGRSFHSVGEIWMNGYSSITNVLGHNWPYQFKINFITKWIWF